MCKYCDAFKKAESLDDNQVDDREGSSCDGACAADDDRASRPRRRISRRRLRLLEEFRQLRQPSADEVERGADIATADSAAADIATADSTTADVATADSAAATSTNQNANISDCFEDEPERCVERRRGGRRDDKDGEHRQRLRWQRDQLELEQQEPAEPLQEQRRRNKQPAAGAATRRQKGVPPPPPSTPPSDSEPQRHRQRQPRQQRQKQQQQQPVSCKGDDDDSQWSSGEPPLSLSLEDVEILDLEGLMELPSEEIDFPPPRYESDTDDVDSPEGGVKDGGGGGSKSGGGDGASAEAEAADTGAGKPAADDGAERRRRKKSKKKKKAEEAEKSSVKPKKRHQRKAEDDGADAEEEDDADSESLFDCQPDTENEYYSLPDI